MTSSVPALRVLEAPALPTTCPSWCAGGHQETLDGTDDLDWASRHAAAGRGGYVAELRNHIDQRVMRDGGGGWDLNLVRRPMSQRGGWHGPALVELDTRDGEGRRVHLELTTGEARTLIAQLQAFADLGDLSLD